MASAEPRGILLLNLGTPEGPTPDKVRPYLREFLMDPYVVDIPAAARWFLVNALIVPRRSHASAALYRKIWTERGSPLLFHTVDFAGKVRRLVGADAQVEVAMRYGRPSVEEAMEAFRRGGVREVIAFPLYPQYSLAATESSVDRIRKAASGLRLSFVPAFYAEEAYLDAVAEVSRPYLERPYDLALFSFHGLPERQVKKCDATGRHCLAALDCCESIGAANAHCYRAQSFHTARELADRLGIAAGRYTVAFQSRLGRTPWIRPFSDELYRTLPAQGVKRIAVLSPSFVADCLETLEEIALRGKEEFVRNGGEDLYLVPSLNAEDAWARAAVRLLETARPA